MAKVEHAPVQVLEGLVERGGLLILAVLAAAAALLLRRRSLGIDKVKAEVFARIIPAAARPYADVILSAAAKEDISPFWIVGIGLRESGWGAASGYRVPPGKSASYGSGDWIARRDVKWLRVPNTRQVTVLPSGWSAPRDSDGRLLSGPFVIPSDQQGWGRGLMQLDWENAQKVRWYDARENVAAGARHLAADAAFFKLRDAAGPRPLSGDALAKATFASYNAGAGRVLAALRAGKAADVVTTGQNYASDVLARTNTIQDAFKTA